MAASTSTPSVVSGATPAWRPRVVLFVALKVAAGVAIVAGAPLAGIVIARSREVAGAAAPAASTRGAAASGPSTGADNDFVGVLVPPQMANLSPKADGRVLAVPVKLGESVRAGEALVSLDPREKQHDLAMAEAQLRVSQAGAAAASSDYAAARKRASRRKATVEVDGQQVPLVSAEEATQASFEAQSAGAHAALASAKIAEQKAKVSLLRLALEETALYAPFDGVVTGIYFQPGMTAHTGDVVVRVVGGQGLRVRIAVPEEASELVHRKRARLELEGRTLFATIDQVSLEVEPASRSFLIEGSVDLAPDTCAGDCAALASRAVRASLVRSGE